jgi:hypothetical protein
MEQLYLSNKDIMELVPCGKNKASEIRKRAILDFNGLNPLLPRKVKKEAVMKVLERMAKL